MSGYLKIRVYFYLHWKLKTAKQTLIDGCATQELMRNTRINAQRKN